MAHVGRAIKDNLQGDRRLGTRDTRPETNINPTSDCYMPVRRKGRVIHRKLVNNFTVRIFALWKVKKNRHTAASDGCIRQLI